MQSIATETVLMMYSILQMAQVWTSTVMKFQTNASALQTLLIYGSVNASDLLILLGEWGTPGILADLNADDIVDIEDLLIFIANWGDCE